VRLAYWVDRYFDDAGNAEFLEKLAASLKTGGALLLDANVTETLLPNFQARNWSEVRASHGTRLRTNNMGCVLADWRLLCDGGPCL